MIELSVRGSSGDEPRLTRTLATRRVGMNAAMTIVATTIASTLTHAARGTTTATLRCGRESGSEGGFAS